MSQDPDPQRQQPAGSPPPSLHKGSDDPGQPPAYPQAPAPYPPPPGPYPGLGPIGYGPDGGYGGTQQAPRNGLGIAALVLGIASIPLGVFFFPVGILLGILAVIFGVVGMVRAKKGRATNRGVAIGGLVTGLVGAAIGVVFLVVFVNIFSDCSNQLGSNATSEQIQQCATDQLTG